MIHYINELKELLYVISDFLVDWGHIGLSIYTVLETLLLIPPIEVILIPLVVANPSEWLLYALNAIVFTFFASIVGYYIGMKLGYPILYKMTSENIVKKGEKFINDYGILAVALVAITPIPYTIIVFLAGIGRMKFSKYIIAAMFGRIPRFLAVSYVAAYLSEQDNQVLTFVSIGVVAVIIIYFLYDKYKKNRTT